MVKRGKLIVLEACDGGGKSTQVKIIKNYLKNNKKLSCQTCHFPAYKHNQFSDIIAKFLRGEFGSINEVDPLFVANIYAMDRFRFSPELDKYLNEYDVVLLDRYVYSNIAYQCAKLNTEEEIKQLKEWILKFEFEFLKLHYPDLNLFLDVPIEITKTRLQQRLKEDREYLNGKQDIHEADIEFQSKVRDNYLSTMKNAPNCRIITCAIQENNNLNILKPEELFLTYKKYLDYVIFNIPI